jgi:hypothetical protein
MVDDDKQPVLTKGRMVGSPFRKGGHKSVKRLNQLDFDPIKVLVDKYNQLEKEIEYQNKRRSGAIVELLPSGKPRSYSYEHHMALYDRQLRVGEQLLRYGYGRVPEVVQIEEKRIEPLVVNLTKEGDTFIINESKVELLEEDDE